MDYREKLRNCLYTIVKAQNEWIILLNDHGGDMAC